MISVSRNSQVQDEKKVASFDINKCLNNYKV